MQWRLKMLDTKTDLNTSIEQLPADLRTLAEVELSNARRRLEQRGRLTPSIVMRAPDGEMLPYRMSDREADILFGNSENKKEYAAILREVIERGGITAVAMVNDIWGGRPTEKLLKLPAEEINQIIRTIRTVEDGVKNGYFTRTEAVLVSIQTAEYVAMVQQEYLRDNAARQIIWLDRSAGLYPQNTFTGTMKMYGKK